MNFEVSHKTLYRYSQPVVQSQHLVHMSPRVMPNQTIRHHSLMVEPAPAKRFEGQDAFGNPVMILDIEVPHQEFVIHSRTSIETSKPPAFNASASTPWDRLDDALLSAGHELPIDVIQYRCGSRQTMPTPEVAAYAELSFPPGRPVIDGAIDLSLRIFKEFKFDPSATDVSTPITEVLLNRRGVCQDFAHLALACLRALRIPARYVSGYILTRPPPGKPRLQGTDASHAWISVWSPETDWVDLDPTNGLVVSDEHITIALGRDYDDISPISGVLLGGGTHSVTVGIDVIAV